MNRPEILDKASAIVCGQREKDYGTPENNFKRIADLWNAYTGTEQFNAVDVSMMLGLLKIARIKTGSGSNTADSFIDLAGYAACGGEIATQTDDEHDSIRDPVGRFVDPYSAGTTKTRR